uniref:Uncharacterized protein n=1 Tax=Arundo donax TaxID=35708 RepID=A0A0A9GP58_ARUDO
MPCCIDHCFIVTHLLVHQFIRVITYHSHKLNLDPILDHTASNQQ